MPEWSAEIRRRLEGLRIDPAREASIVEELSQHLEDRYEELVARRRGPGGRAPVFAGGARRRRPGGRAEGVASAPGAAPHAAPRGGPRALRRPRQGFPLRRAAPAAGAGLRARRHPVPRARHRREHGDLPAARRGPPAEPAGRAARRARERPHRKMEGPHGQLLGALPGPDVPSLRADPRRAEGVLTARGLELRPHQPRLRRRGALRRGHVGQRNLLRHRRGRAAAGTPPRPLRRPCPDAPRRPSC